MSVSRPSDPSSRPRRPRRVVGLATVGTLLAGLAVAVAVPAGTASAAPTPPPNPTDQQLSAAAARKVALASQVGQLSGQLQAAQQRLQQYQAAVELAEQKVAYRITELRNATTAREAAAKKLADLNQRTVDAKVLFARYMQATYQSGRPAGMTGTLLTAQDPSNLLDASMLLQYETEHKAGVVGQMQRLAVEQSNAEATTRRLVEREKKLTREAQDAQAAAAQAVQNQQAQNVTIQQSIDSTQAALSSAQSQLADLNGQRAAYNAYVAEQKRLAEIARQKRLAEQRRRAEIARQKRLAAERARERARNHGGGGGGGGGSDTWTPPRNSPGAPSGGGWTAAKGRAAVRRAASTLGTPYAWAGGGVGGPSYGACVPSAGAPNDCYVRGYDCSGLAMYAWGRNWDHYAATQYNQAGSYHPSRSNLKPGDLLFFSNGGVSGIHHVAIYSGGGQMIEAPYSGGYVQYNSIYAYSDYYGATRPLT